MKQITNANGRIIEIERISDSIATLRVKDNGRAFRQNHNKANYLQFGHKSMVNLMKLSEVEAAAAIRELTDLFAAEISVEEIGEGFAPVEVRESSNDGWNSTYYFANGVEVSKEKVIDCGFGILKIKNEDLPKLEIENEEVKILRARISELSEKAALHNEREEIREEGEIRNRIYRLREELKKLRGEK